MSREEFTRQLNTVTDARLSDQSFGVSELAREMEISRSTLHRKVKEVFHESASQFISHKRLERARQLLLGKKISVTETASRCGFHSVTYFDKCFSGYFGYPPGETGKHSLEGKKPVPKEKFEFLKKWFKLFK
ncbi:MAG: helix-turn-helix transcriptional regulator [Prolixibacteraceae bacterium]|nr:helix-turn-helix transcriptional regulator [Prolixibacteraceae bacterium]